MQALVIAHCADHSAAPMRRSRNGSITPVSDTWIHTRDLPAAWMAWSEAAAHETVERTPSEGSHNFFFFFIMAIRAAVAGLGLALLPRVLIEQELASGRWVRMDG
jgi:DNA-binding transcriptional LysR family regulator